ncbi:DUF4199 family protein [Chryseolinea sp. T2]|uniref:DUF4199 family protein n=1 Tax=Chryseolinea sp. T2 TaxID=3129255 RepID=UPI00307732B2
MNKTALNVSIKYGVLLGVLTIASASLLFGISSGANQGIAFVAIATAVLIYIVKLGIIARSHYEYNEKNNDYISFKDAILIGLVVLGISAVMSVIFQFVGYNFLMKEKYEAAWRLALDSGISPLRIILSGMVSGVIIDVIFLFLIIMMESMWKIFKKAGKDGWAALIPFYNTITLLDIVGKPVIWFLLMFIPIVNVVLGIWVINLLAKRFGKSDGFTVGMIFLPFIFYPLLGMSEEQMIPLPEQAAY